MKKKNYTVNDVLDFNSEKKYNQNNNEDIRDKSEEIRLSNKNERKMSLIQIDEKEEQNKNNNNNSSEEKDEKNKNKEKVAKKKLIMKNIKILNIIVTIFLLLININNKLFQSCKEK